MIYLDTSAAAKLFYQKVEPNVSKDIYVREKQ